MSEVTVCTARGRFQTNADIRSIHRIRQDTSDTLWVDLVAPSPDEIDVLREEFKFHPLAIEDATRQHQRPKVDAYGDYYFAVFYCLGTSDSGDRITMAPIYIFIGGAYLVTIHAEPIEQVAETLRRWRDPNSPLGQDIGSLIWALLDAIVDDYFPVIDRIADRIEDLEQIIFREFDQGALEVIFGLKKDLLAARRVVAPERDVINVMLRRDIAVFDEHDVPYLQDVYDHIIRIIDSLDTYRDLLSSALDTFLSVQSNRLNLVVKALTVTSIVLMSVTVVAGIYGMNFDYMPELHWRYGYAWALGLMVAISAGLIAWFRRIKWL